MLTWAVVGDRPMQDEDMRKSIERENKSDRFQKYHYLVK